ncbi:MAG TPA: DPP IV N-terminal domain-containing protein [Candidatus Acidoferrales bacterium]|nr:DPP IV N-terminal domain-containing protein [Candidatus Acidoferrales bacterium]
MAKLEGLMKWHIGWWSVGLSAIIAFSVLSFPSVKAQESSANSKQVLTATDYAHAEQLMSYNANRLVYGAERATWLSDDRFWYRSTSPDGSEFIIVDAATGQAKSAFDHAALASALSTATGAHFDARHLPTRVLGFSEDGATISFAIRGKRWECDLHTYECTAKEAIGAVGLAPPSESLAAQAAAARNESLSPDGKNAVFIRDYNLWVRDVAGGKETQLTTDGVKDFGYATDNAGWTHSDRPIVLWSPDSRKIATYQQDQRGDGEMYLVHTQVGHPTLEEWKYPLPGDPVVTTILRVVIDLDGPRFVRFQMPPDQHRSTLCDDVACRAGDWSDVQWSPDSTHVAFVSTSRDHKHEQLRVADAATGEIRDVLHEDVSTFYESGNGGVDWRYLPASNEVIWFSERDNWGQLYLYDLQSGQLKNQITTGEGNVTQVLRVDEKNRLIYFLAVGKEKGRDPYFIHFYRIGFDGSGLKLLTPENANHEVTISHSGKYFVDSYSTPDTPPVTVLRDASGKLMATVQKANISRLLATGWKPPVPFTVKARDGVTDLYGLMFKPTDLDPNKKYPIINHIYPGPQTGSVGSRSFSAARGDCQSLAELGFVVVEIDGMGTPWRSKKFHEAYYGDMGDNTLPDQVAGMKQLAQRYPWIDIDRAGIYGHSGGGFATADAMFRYPDFFKVGISESGNHDNREYEDDWAEKWQGLLVHNPDGSTNYDGQANQLIAKNLKGHLLLAHGTIDNNVPPYNTLLVVDALIKANKDFDLIMLPNERHGYADDTPYMTRRRWDYFVRYLLGAEPPHEYKMHGGDPPSI